MGQMYALDAFTQSCPADQDIINHYKQQMHVKPTRHEELEAPTFTNSLPSGTCESKSIAKDKIITVASYCYSFNLAFFYVVVFYI